MADIAFTADAPAASHISFTAEEPTPSPQEEEQSTQIGGELGAGEMAGSLISGTAGQIVGGLGMAGKAATNVAGLTTGDPLDVARGISGAMTYQPRTEEGQAATEALSRGMAAMDRPIERAEDWLDPSGNLKATAQDVAERGSYVAGAAQAAAPFMVARVPELTPGPRPPAPPKAAPGPLTAEDLRASPERLPSPTTKAPEPQAPAPGVQTPGKLRVRLKPQGEPAPAPAAPAEPPALKAPARDEAEIAGGAAPSTDEQAARVGAVQQLQQDTGAIMPHVRRSAVTGDFRETGTDHQLAELGDPTMRAQIDSENAALKTASQAQVDSTGGKARGMGQGALEARGTTIDRALQGIGDWFDTNIRQLYRTADAQAGGVPMQKFNSLQGLLGDHSQFTGVEGRQLHQDIAQVARQFGMMGQDGFWKPTTVATAEKFRQWLGEQYSPRTGRTIARLKDAIDSDVASHGGQGLYDAGRALRYKRDQFLEGPTGIRKLMPEKLPDGRLINRPVSLDKVADHIANLPREQFDHIINVLHDSAKLGKGELAEANAAAINELRRHMAETLHEAGSGGRDGQWNPHNYHDQLDAYSTKLPAVFSPEGLRRFNTIHDAGNALRVNKRYPGAAKQIMQAGGLRALAGDRIAHIVEGAVSGALGPVGGALTEAVGAGRMLRTPIQRLISGNPEARQAAKVGGRLQPLGERIGGGKQRGAIGDLSQRDAIEHDQGAPSAGTIEHSYRTPNDNGTLRVVETPGRGIRQVTSSEVDKSARGQGWGTQMLAKAADDAHAAGQVLHSDSNVSAGQAGAYKNLAQLGYKVTKKDSDFRGGAHQAVGDHVFEVRPRPSAPLSQRGGPEFLARRNPSTGQPSRYPNPAERPPTPSERLTPPVNLAGKFPGQRGGPKSVPKGEPAAAGYQASKELESFVRKQAPAHRVDPKGPASWEELQARRNEKVMPINPQSAEGSIYSSVPTNIAFRAWHDKTHLDLNAGFDHEGEMKVALEHQKQAKAAGLSEDDRRALWADTWETFKHHEDTGEFPSNPREFVAKRMQNRFPGDEPPTGGSTFNVGLHQGIPGEPGFRKMSKQEAQKAIESTGAKVTKSTVLTPEKHGVSEPTLVANTDRSLNHGEMQSVLAKTKQSSIPQRTEAGDESMHITPGHEERAAKEGWDTFNPDYFREHNGKTASENAAEHHVTSQLTEPERASLRADTTKRLIEQFLALPDTPEFAAAALAGKAKRGWYRASAEAISNTFGPDAPRFSAVLSAMSPQQSVQGNFHNALRTFVNWDKAGRPTEPAAIKQIMQDSVQKQIGGKGVLPAWENNTIRALTADDPTKIALSGPKVHSFYHNLIGHTNEVTNDAWMAIFSKIDPSAAGSKMGGSLSKKGPGKSSTYLAMSAKVRAAARMLSNMTGEAWTPAEVQETVWSWAKTAYEHSEELGDHTIPELVKHGKLTDELIRSTPDFHQLFGTPEHRGFLLRSRYAENLERLANAKGAGAVPSAPSKASAAAENTLHPFLMRAAERLESVRQERNAARAEPAPF